MELMHALIVVCNSLAGKKKSLAKIYLPEPSSTSEKR